MCQNDSFSVDVANTVDFLMFINGNVYCFKNINATDYLVVSLFPRLILYINFKVLSIVNQVMTDEEI